MRMRPITLPDTIAMPRPSPRYSAATLNRKNRIVAPSRLLGATGSMATSASASGESARYVANQTTTDEAMNARGRSRGERENGVHEARRTSRIGRPSKRLSLVRAVASAFAATPPSASPRRISRAHSGTVATR